MNSTTLLPFALSVTMTSLGCFSSLGGGDGDLSRFTMNDSGFYDLIYDVVAALAIAVGADLAASTKRIAAAPMGSHILIKVIV